MAAAFGQPFTYTLTGFKWIGRVPDLAFGYEEAIGFLKQAVSTLFDAAGEVLDGPAVDPLT